MLESLLQLRHKIETIVVPRSNSGSLADPSSDQTAKEFTPGDSLKPQQVDVFAMGQEPWLT